MGVMYIIPLLKAEMVEAPVRIWRTVKDFPLYQVSNDGRVRKVDWPIGVFLAVRFSTKGRPRHALRRDGKSFTIETHILVGQAFLPPGPPDKPWILHHDDNPLNCVDTN